MVDYISRDMYLPTANILQTKNDILCLYIIERIVIKPFAYNITNMFSYNKVFTRKKKTNNNSINNMSLCQASAYYLFRYS